MNILINRTYFDDRTEGNLKIDGVSVSDTLERAWGIADHPCIPEGTYPVITYKSPHNKREVPLLENVPGRSMIEIHPANHTSELLGCIAPGLNDFKGGVILSTIHFNRIMTLVKGAIADNEKIFITLQKSE